MKKENKETVKQPVLTVDELKKMSDTLSDMRDIIELYNHALYVTPAPEDVKEEALNAQYHALYALTDTMFHKNQAMMNDLNKIGYLLAKNNDEKEIEELRKSFN